jgi:hypothetical protein
LLWLVYKLDLQVALVYSTRYLHNISYTTALPQSRHHACMVLGASMIPVLRRPIRCGNVLS